MTFAAPLMLIGLIAAGIPPLLHLLSRVRAKEEPFPTLRFLQHCLEKTARRRRIEHWLLLLLRSAALAVLAMALAEPISRTAGWAGGEGGVAALLVDNSYSMGVGRNGLTRLGRAKSQAVRRLRDSAAPAMAAVIATAGTAPTEVLSTQLDAQQRKADAVTLDFGPDHLSERFAQAAEELAGQANPKRSICYFGDLQRQTLATLLASPAFREAGGMKLFFLDAAQGPVDNVGITDVSITGSCVADAVVTFHATILNSGPSPRQVDVTFHPDGVKQAARRITQLLAPAGRDGDKATLAFTHHISQPGWSLGEIRIEQADDLLADNRRRYCLNVTPHVQTLVVCGPGRDDPGAMLSLALDWRGETQAGKPWPIRVTKEQADAFTPESLSTVGAAFFCDVSTFTNQTADALGAFVRSGGTVWFFLGPNVNVADYNERFGEKGAGLLPGVLGEALGQVGPGADVFLPADVAEDHPLFADLFDAPADYRTTRTQRFFSFQPSQTRGRVLMSLTGGGPLLVEQAAGKGRAVWCMTTADPRWTNLASQPIFLPMVVRSVMQSPRDEAGPATYSAGQTVKIRPGKRAPNATRLRVTPPGGGDAKPIVIPLEDGMARFTQTDRLGVYRWEALDNDGKVSAGGAFVVNPYGPECDLTAYTPAELQAELQSRGFQQAYVAATLDELRASDTVDAQGRNFWDVLTAAVILLLLVEAVAANRRKIVVGSQ